MRLFESTEPEEALSGLLDRERRAILKGNYAGLAGILAQKEHLLSRIGQRNPDAKRVHSLRVKANRNQVLLKAAIDGIGSVLRDLGKPQQPATLETYDRSGDRCSSLQESPSLERRF